MKRAAYLDCFSGVSGDMLLAALVDLGLPLAHLRQVLAALPVEGMTLEAQATTVGGIAAQRLRLHSPQTHVHRGLNDIQAILASSTLGADIKARALRVFTRLAEAEAAVHGTTVADIHFHEVGALDAIADVVGVLAGFRFLRIDEIHASSLPMPSGWIQSAHGHLPLPAPAVCRLLAGAPVHGEALAQELVTPTGAALVRELAQSFGPMPAMILEGCGYGAGSMQRDDGRPNLLRILVGSLGESREARQVIQLEAHMDDGNPEHWPFISERLMEAGALDVALIPMLMKKGRPGFLLRVISEPVDAQPLAQIIFTETSTIGLRMQRQDRLTLPRERIMVPTPWGELQAQQAHTPEGPVISPEYEACQALAKQKGISLRRIYAAVNAANQL